MLGVQAELPHVEWRLPGHLHSRRTTTRVRCQFQSDLLLWMRRRLLLAKRRVYRDFGHAIRFGAKFRFQWDVNAGPAV